MITSYKLFEQIDMSDFEYPTSVILITQPDPLYYRKLTYGKRYKLYQSSLGFRIKDDNGEFLRLQSPYFFDASSPSGTSEDYDKISGIYYFRDFAKNRWSTDKSIEDFEMRKSAEKFGI